MGRIDDLEQALEAGGLDVAPFDTAVVVFGEERVAAITNATATTYVVYGYERRRDYVDNEIDSKSTHDTFADALIAAGEYHDVDIAGAAAHISHGT